MKNRMCKRAFTHERSRSVDCGRLQLHTASNACKHNALRHSFQLRYDTFCAACKAAVKEGSYSEFQQFLEMVSLGSLPNILGEKVQQSLSADSGCVKCGSRSALDCSEEVVLGKLKCQIARPLTRGRRNPDSIGSHLSQDLSCLSFGVQPGTSAHLILLLQYNQVPSGFHISLSDDLLVISVLPCSIWQPTPVSGL